MKFEIKNRLDKQLKFLKNYIGGDWKPSETLGYEYWVNDRGYIASMFNPCGSLRNNPKFLKQRLSKNGYLSVAFKGKNKLVHRIIANDFIGKTDNKVVHHIDGNRENNAVCNLEITSTSKNNSHGHKTRNLNKKIITELIRYYRK